MIEWKEQIALFHAWGDAVAGFGEHKDYLQIVAAVATDDFTEVIEVAKVRQDAVLGRFNVEVDRDKWRAVWDGTK